MICKSFGSRNFVSIPFASLARSLQASMAAEFFGEVKLRVPGVASEFRCAVRALQEAQDGERLWWSLPHVYSFMQGDAGKPWNEIRNKGWKSWSSMLAKMDIGGTPLLKSSVHDPTKGIEGPTNNRSWSAASTRGLIALLLRWSSQHAQNGRIDRISPGATMLLDWFFNELNVPLRVATSDIITPDGYTVDGQAMVEFQVVDGVVALDGVFEAQMRACALCLPGLRTETSCSVRELLSAAPAYHRRLSGEYGFTPQLIWVIGPLVEQRVLGRVEHPRAWPADWWVGAQISIDGNVERKDRGAFLHAYQRQMAQLLHGADVVACAADDSRVAREPWKVIAVLDTSKNFTGWLAPQARRMALSSLIKAVY